MGDRIDIYIILAGWERLTKGLQQGRFYSLHLDKNNQLKHLS